MAYYQASLLYLSNFVEPYQLFSQLKVFIFLPTKFRKKAEMLFASTRIYDEEEKGNWSFDEDFTLQNIQQIKKVQKTCWNYKHLCSLSKWKKFKKTDCKDKNNLKRNESWGSSGKAHANTWLLLKLLTYVVCADKSQSLITRPRQIILITGYL